MNKRQGRGAPHGLGSARGRPCSTWRRRRRRRRRCWCCCSHCRCCPVAVLYFICTCKPCCLLCVGSHTGGPFLCSARRAPLHLRFAQVGAAGCDTYSGGLWGMQCSERRSSHRSPLLLQLPRVGTPPASVDCCSAPPTLHLPRRPTDLAPPPSVSPTCSVWGNFVDGYGAEARRLQKRGIPLTSRQNRCGGGAAVGLVGMEGVSHSVPAALRSDLLCLRRTLVSLQDVRWVGGPPAPAANLRVWFCRALTPHHPCVALPAGCGGGWAARWRFPPLPMSSTGGRGWCFGSARRCSGGWPEGTTSPCGEAQQGGWWCAGAQLQRMQHRADAGCTAGCTAGCAAGCAAGRGKGGGGF